MGDLDSVVNVSIVVQSGALSVVGFGIPMLLGASVPAAFTERLRYYTEPSAMLTDGFLATDWAYIAAVSLMSQRPRPKKFAVGRRATAVAQMQTFVTPTSPQLTTTYALVINGVSCPYTTDGTPTQAELRDNLILAVNNSTQGALVLASASGNNIVVTSRFAGIPFTYSITAGPLPAITLPVQTQLFVIPPTPNSSTLYRVRINGIVIDVTTDPTATQAELQAALISQINLLAGTAVLASASTNDVLVTALVAGTNFSYSISSGPAANITKGAATGADPNVGIAEDLAAISEYQPDWYALLIEQRTDLHILVAAAAVEAQKRVFVCQSSAAGILASPYDALTAATGDIASRLRALGYVRTSAWYHPTDAAALDAAVVGRCIGAIPGSLTWMFKELAGVTATRLTETQRTNLESKNCNGYRPMAGKSITYPGKMSQGRFIDITHGLDKMESRIKEFTVGSLIALDKVNFDDPGLGIVTSGISMGIRESERDNFVAKSKTLPNGDIQAPSWTVTAPKVADIPPADREARRIPQSNPFRFDGIFAGAVHSVEVAGTLSF